MGVISIQEARGIFKKSLAVVFKEKAKTTGYLRSLFRTVENDSKYVSIEVSRASEKIAVDILTGTEGRLNHFTRSTEKIIEPQLFDEKFNATHLDIYDQLHISKTGSIDIPTFEKWNDVVVDKLVELKNKIVRAEEVKCSQVLIDGIVTSDAVSNVDFKRQAGSKVDLGAGNYWATSTIDPIAQIAEGCDWMRKNGLVSGSGVYTLILGSQAAIDLANNPIFKAKGDLKNITLLTMNMEKQLVNGNVPFGTFMAGSYMVEAFTYPQYYDNASDVKTAYIDPKKAVLIADGADLTMQYASVPMLLSDVRAIANVKGQFHIYDYIDEARTGHYYGVRSKSLPVPITVDQIYTIKAVA